MNRTDQWNITCLVRAADDESACERVLNNLRTHHVNLGEDPLSRLTCLAAKLPEPSLGLQAKAYDDLAHKVDLVIHAAWPVHFSAGLQSFVPHLQGLRNLISLAGSNDADVYFCSSIAAVLGGTSKTIEERIYTDPSDAVAIGYARSKFVAENICAAAAKAAGKSKISVLRLGQLSGDTVHGIWKTEEGWPQLFGSAGLVGCLPELNEVGIFRLDKETFG
jgi:thioester reductase-like protein